MSSFSPQIFIECLLCIYHCSKSWGYSSEQKKQKKCIVMKLILVVGDRETKQVNFVIY